MQGMWQEWDSWKAMRSRPDVVLYLVQVGAQKFGSGARSRALAARVAG